MGRTRYYKCVKLLAELKSENKELFTLDELKNAVREKIGDDVYRTIKPSIALMIDLNLIKVMEDGIRIQ